MFNSIFGTAATNAAAQNMFGQSTSTQSAQGMQNAHQGGLANQNTYYNALQQSALYNQMLNQRTARWMIDGEVCYSVKDFAKKLFPEDEQAQLMLVLRFGDV